MEYMLSVQMVDGAPPRPADEQQQAYDDVDKVNAELQDAGAWVFAGGLQPASTATVVRADGAKTLVTDGPFTEAKEHIGGFWIIDVADLDAALEWAAKATRACREPVEVRPFQGVPQA
jgi:hypothetical protein